MISEKAVCIDRDVNIHLENKGISRSFFWFIWVLYAVVCMTKNCYSGALASIVSEGVLTKSQTGFISAMFYLVYTPLQIVGGFLCDRKSPELLIKIGLLGAAISNTVIFFCQNYYVMLAAWIFNGIVQFGIWPSVFKIVSSQLVRSERSNMVFYLSFSGLSGPILSFLVAAVVPNWKYNFAISAISLLFFLVALHFIEKSLAPHMKWDKEEESSPEKEEKQAKPPMLKIFLASGFFVMLIGMLPAVVVSQTRSVLTSIMFVENYDSVAPSLGNILTSVMLIAGMAGTVLARKIMSRIKNEVAFIAVISLLKLPFLAVCVLVGTLPISSIIVCFSLVACFEAIESLSKNYYTVYFSKYRLNGAAAGILNAGNALAYTIAGYVMPLIVEKFGWTTLLILLPLLIVFSTVCFSLIIKRFKAFKEEALQ
ncbi:MAG: MFS transporter [Oscillospiraceae bacterium]|nr:MFS transporter [Oscillospiraceae bacterium]